ncbi:hypothetical protein JIN84_11510 [Luteolibacter yonseiensis]|uniref:Uncharacterized protein n=1 Tax=Luteolibacter yonseiensis TaxID=1144680 RepID=A0A934R4S4_9BACT|nr:hypothetical protein [Luteolibacter yonseiensis]MBK1816241.1 hypothetical protein [Luteolibacter yonseiensis]
MLFMQVAICDRDVETSAFPRWELLLLDTPHPLYSSRSILRLEWSTRSDGKWGRRNYHRTVHLDLSDDEINILILGTGSLPESWPDECLYDTDVHTHGGRSPTRENKSAAICRAITWVIDGHHKRFHIRKDSLVWSDSAWGLKIMNQVSPHIVETPWNNQNQKRRLP